MRISLNTFATGNRIDENWNILIGHFSDSHERLSFGVSCHLLRKRLRIEWGDLDPDGQ